MTNAGGVTIGRSGSWRDTWSDEAKWKQEASALLPEFVQGWYLLFDGNLDTNERNMVIAALRETPVMSRVSC
jgi:hypothetical protein